MGSIEKKLDTTLCAAALLVVFALFILISVPAVRRGLSSADDAFFAVIAKSIAVGKGYGLPRSNKEFVPFDETIGTGPALILPIAFLIWVFGSGDQLPGAATLVIFIIQLVVTAIVLARRFGWTPTFGFLAALLWLLMLTGTHNWYFGSFLGEPVAFGFILIGSAFLAVARGDRAIVASGLCFSLAFLTKQISLFAVAGGVVGWLIVSALNHEKLRLLVRRVAILVLAGSSLPVAFEATKLVKVGMGGYLNLWKLTMKVTASRAIGTGTQSERLTTFLTVLTNYTSLALLVGLAIGSAILFYVARRNRDKGDGSVGRFAVFAWTAAVAYLVYILVFSILWPRYFWIGIAILLTAICAPLLAMESRLRVATLLVLLVCTLGLATQLFELRRGLMLSPLPAERAAVVRLLDAHPDLPYVAPGWSSVFDVLYLRGNEGIWTYDPNVIRPQDGDFIALINIAFTNKADRFLRYVVNRCEPLTPHGRLTAYRCSESFREAFRTGAIPPSPPVGVALDYDGVVDRRDCETVGGWVMKTADPEADIKVELYIDDKLAETVPAKNLRPDLNAGTGRYGFSFKLPAAYKDDWPHKADVRVAGSEYRVPFYDGVFSGFECKP